MRKITKKMNLEDSEHKLKKLNLEFNKNVKKYETIESGIQAATKAHNHWKGTSYIERANFLHKIWMTLSEKSHLFIKSDLIKENEFSLIVEYFNIYSDLLLLIDEQKNWEPIGVVLVVLSHDTPFYVLSAIVSAAIAAGCSLIVQLPENRLWFPLLLAHVFVEVGLPNSLLNIEPVPAKTEFSSDKIQKAIFCGSFLEAQNFYSNSLSRSMSFMCPSNTAALVAESCDLSSAVDKIFSETWCAKYTNLWGVSTVVVQESIYRKFLDKLKFRIEQMLSENRIMKLKNKTILDKINDVKMKATKAGATIEEYSVGLTEWTPTVIVHYQDPDIEPDVPVLKVLICRTAKEGVTLLNNSNNCHGVSVWTEISSQALEIASMLSHKNIWINCHGAVEPSVPFQITSYTGSCLLGGYEGLFEYMCIPGDYSLGANKGSDENEFAPEKLKVLKTGLSGQSVFKKWDLEKNKRKIIKDIANSFKDNKEFSKVYDIINYYAHSGKLLNFSENNCQDFYFVYKKIPVGVIAVYIGNSPSDISGVISSIITPTVAFGNAVILVLKEKNATVEFLVKQFNKFLPKNLLSLVVGSTAMVYFASDPTVQVLWFYSEHLSGDYLELIKSHAAKTLKNIWIIPKNIPLCQELFQKECLRSKVIWLTKADQFP